jgi:hypothetical protein
MPFLPHRAHLNTVTSRRLGLPLLLWRRLEFGHIPRSSVAEANPQGWQKVAGGRSGQRGERPPERRRKVLHPGEGARRERVTTARACAPGSYGLRFTQKSTGSGTRPTSSLCGSDESGTPAGVQGLSCSVARRSPPKRTRRPPATVWQPCGLTFRVDAPIHRIPSRLLKNTPGEGTGPTSIANYLESCRPRALTRRSEGFSTAC